MMNAHRVLGLLFAIVILTCGLVLVFALAPTIAVQSQDSSGVAWEKEAWLNGDPVALDSITVEAGDVVQVVDRVWITNTGGLRFALGALWTESLELSGSSVSGGEMTTMPGQLAWELDPVEPNTWHVLTRTFDIQPGLWLTDLMTDTLDVELFGEEVRVLSLHYRAADLYISKTVDPPNQVPTEMVTYTIVWGNDGGWAPGVLISDTLPAAIVFVDASPPGVYDSTTHTVVWGPFDLDTGDRTEVVVHGTIAADVLPDTSLTNTVYLLYADVPPLVAQAVHRSISPCVKVESVAMSVLSAAPFYTNEQLQILADITPDDAGVPFRYQVVVDGVAAPTMAALAEPLSLSLAMDTKGEHMVELRIWNCNLSIGQYVSDSFVAQIQPYLLYLPLVLGNF